jgi:hypothetical protein
MPIYKKRVSTRDPRFKNRNIGIFTPKSADIIPIPDTEVICNNCNNNIYSTTEETFGWLIYFSKRDVKADRPYDFYCDKCVQKNFPDAIEVQ